MATSSCFSGFTGNVCGNGFGDPSGYAVAWYLYAADLVLEQTEGPSARNVSGPLATESPVDGTSDVIFSATDPGSGMYQAVFTVDGHVVQETVINENGGHCRNVGQTTDGLPAFLYLQPCLKSLTADVGFDSTRVGNGPHHLVVSVSDAAGNTATVLDRSIVVQNELGICNAECDGHASLRAADARPSPWNHHSSLRQLWVHPHGPARGPRRGADAGGNDRTAPASQLPRSTERVGRDDYDRRQGRVEAPCAEGPVAPHHGRLSLAQQQPAPSPRSFSTARRSLRTCGCQLRDVARPGRTFAFRGGLTGGYIPPGGALVSLEIFFGGEWREIALLRTNRRGAFAYRYTFAAIGPATYRFRAQLPHTIGYPVRVGREQVQLHPRGGMRSS